MLHIKQDSQPTNIKQFPSWNYKKANWTEFQAKAYQYCKDMDLGQQHLNNKVKRFTTAILTAATETIPRGRRRNYIPLWNEQHQELHNAVSKLREKMEHCPTDENTQAHNKANAEYTRQKLQQTRAAWHEKTSSLNFEKDICKLWKLTKLLNEDNPERRQTVPESEGELLTQKRAANCLAKHYQEESSVKLSRERTDNCMTEAISMEEVELAIRQLKCKKAPGPSYGVTNYMIKTAYQGNIVKTLQ